MESVKVPDCPNISKEVRGLTWTYWPVRTGAVNVCSGSQVCIHNSREGIWMHADHPRRVTKYLKSKAHQMILKLCTLRTPRPRNHKQIKY